MLRPPKRHRGTPPTRGAFATRSGPPTLQAGYWDAIHVVEVRPVDAATAHYKLTSTVMLSLDTDHSTKSSSSAAQLKLSGSMTRQAEEKHPGNKDDDHLKNVGRMLEEMENRMRDSLQARHPSRRHSSRLRAASAPTA